MLYRRELLGSTKIVVFPEKRSKELVMSYRRGSGQDPRGIVHVDEHGYFRLPYGKGESSFDRGGIVHVVCQSNSGIDENGNRFHSVDDPYTGETVVTIHDAITGDASVTRHKRR